MYSKIKRNGEGDSSWILLPEQMDVLSKKPYIYHASAGSVLELLFLQKFWMWLANFIPTQIAPCVLTCVGLGINLATCITLLYFSPDARTEAPSWVYVLCGIGVFLYQTLDALDGKQAIKVQNSPIEEVYDHGCDAISTIFVGLTTAAAVSLGSSPLLMYAIFIASMLAFYTSHWQDHVTHQMIFGKLDVSEAQISVMCIHLATAIYGQHIWKQEIFGAELRIIFGIASLIFLMGTIISNARYVLGKKTPLDKHVHIPRKTGFKIWYPLVPVTALTLCALRAYSSNLFFSSPSIFVIAFGLAYAKITIKLVMTNVTFADMELWDSSLVAPILLSLNTCLPSPFMLPPMPALKCCLVYNFMDLARYFTYISWDMREALDAWIFAIKYDPNHPKSRKGNLGFYVNGLNNTEILSGSSQKS